MELKDGEKIITEGENGDYLFVVDEGKLDCHKDKSTDVLKTCSSPRLSEMNTESKVNT